MAEDNTWITLEAGNLATHPDHKDFVLFAVKDQEHTGDGPYYSGDYLYCQFMSDEGKEFDEADIVCWMRPVPPMSKVQANMDEGQCVGKYDAVMEAFPEGTWVFGIGEHRGCSQTFNYQYPNSPQPFAFLNADNPDDFRFATVSEIQAARERI